MIGAKQVRRFAWPPDDEWSNLENAVKFSSFHFNAVKFDSK